MSECEHNYIYKGVEYSIAEFPMPGTGAKSVCYFDTYFCQRCLKKKHNSMGNLSNTYENIKLNAVPKT